MKTHFCQISRTKDIPKPTYYIKALQGEYSKWAYCEERAVEYKGKWRQNAYNESLEKPMDLEIGTGNGYFFSHYANSNPDRLYLGIELKFKPLIQSIRRALKEGAQNAKILRYDAAFLDDLFEDEELNDVFVHFPDPWNKNHKKKHRLLKLDFLNLLHRLQKSESYVEFKTDSRNYFDFALEEFKKSPYKIVGLSYDLHNSEFAEKNFVTHFEKIFIKQNIPINYLLAQKL